MKTFPWKLDFEISHKTERFGLNCSNAFNEHQLSVICTEFPLLAGLFSIFLMMYKAVIAWENIISGLICAGLTHTSHCMRFQWATYVCASWWVLVFEDLTSSLESWKKTFFFWASGVFLCGFCCLQSGARSFCLSSAEVQNASKSVMWGSLKGKEQEHGQSISRRGWESWVFDKADTELQDCNSFKDVFLFFPPGNRVDSHGFWHQQNDLMGL